MRKLYLLALSLAASASFAQTTLWNGEDVTCTAGQLWGNSTKDIVDNPDKSGINTSDKCIYFKMDAAQGGDAKVVKVPFREWMQPGIGSRRISLMIRKSKSDNVMIELSDPTDGSDGYWHKTAAWYGGGGTWQKITFDFSANDGFDNPGVISITAQTGDEGADGQEVWIDNVVIEDAATVNGAPLDGIADGSLTGFVKLGGAWMKGDCQNTDGEWQRVDYNDFDVLKAKMSAGAVAVDMRGCVLKDAYNAFGGNVIVYADSHVDGENVAVNGTVAHLHLLSDAPFNAPEGFTAEKVTVERGIYEGYNTLTVPFDVTAGELGADLCTFDGISGEGEEKTVRFKAADTVEADTPMLLNAVTAKEKIELENKTVTATPEQPGTGEFKGVYAPRSAEGLWGITGKGEFAKGGPEAWLNAFGAYLDVPGAARLSMDTGTGITAPGAETAHAAAVYNLQGVKVGMTVCASDISSLTKGIYIINGKKVVVK